MDQETPTEAARPRALALPAVMLIAANLVPLIGVLSWEWRVFDVVVLYWFENVVIGGINILKMLVCTPDLEEMDLMKERLRKRMSRPGVSESRREGAERILARNEGKLGRLHHASKLFFIPFFAVHYGMFTMVHGIFVFVLLGGNDSFGSAGGAPFAAFPEMVGEITSGGALWAVLALTASHLVSFVCNFLVRGEYRRAVVPRLMFAPYGRVAVLHIAILGGAFAIQALGSPVGLLVILIAGKIGIDLGLHFRSHRRTRAPR
ncbi:MAG: DUF6498-containing protein [Verrucomicrobiales bacterium]